MTFKRSVSMLSISLQDSKDEVEEQITESVKSNACRVCGDKARIVNYGALSCMSCKTFFRRHGYNMKNAPLCREGGHCEVTMATRRACTGCRLGKCLAVGMASAMIRKEDLYSKTSGSKQSKIKKIDFEEVSTPVPQPPTLDLVCADRSSLSSSDWRLFSNVVHAYDTFSSVTETRREVERIGASPDDPQLNVLNIQTLFSSFYVNVRSFICSTADFRVLSVAEQHSLFERNFHGITSVYSAMMCRDTGFFFTGNCERALTTIYGIERVKRSKKINMQLEQDSTLFKIYLVMLVMSPNCQTVEVHENMHRDSLLNGTFRLFGSQNVYAELLWKYMIYRYGYYDSARRFAALIQRTLDIMNLMVDIRESDNWHRVIAHNILEQALRALTISENQDVPLWGRE